MNPTPLQAFIDTQLTPERFGAWLKEQRPAAWVGVRGNTGHCPLACYLFAASEGRPFGMSDRIYTEGEELPSPAWAIEFMAEVDTGKYQHITAARALRILRRVAGLPV